MKAGVWKRETTFICPGRSHFQSPRPEAPPDTWHLLVLRSLSSSHRAGEKEGTPLPARGVPTVRAAVPPFRRGSTLSPRSAILTRAGFLWNRTEPRPLSRALKRLSALPPSSAVHSGAGGDGGRKAKAEARLHYGTEVRARPPAWGAGRQATTSVLVLSRTATNSAFRRLKNIYQPPRLSDRKSVV